MMDDSTNTLIQRVLDGEATPDERAALDALATADHAVQTERADLEAMVELLTHVEAVAPPADLKRRIMAALPEERYAWAEARPAHRTGTWSLAAAFEALREALTARPAFSYAYAVALGAVVGIAAYVTVSDTATAPAPQEAYGTLASPEAATLLRPIAEHMIAVDGAEGVVRVMGGGESVFVEIEMTPQVQTEVGLAFDPDRLQWSGLTRLDNGTEGTLTTAEGEVRLTLADPARYRFSFASDGPHPALTLTVSEDGVTVYRRVLSAAAPGDERLE